MLKLNLTLLFLVILVVPGLLAQDIKQNAALEEAEQRLRTWQMRVDELTKEIVSDSSSVSEAEQSMYLALLAKMWWKIDEVEARAFLKKAGQKVISSIQSEEKKDLEKRLEFCRKTLAIISALDEKLAITLVGQIESAVDKADDDQKKESQEMADLFAAIGLQVVKTNPKMALACGMDSLIYGFGSGLPELVVELNLQNFSLAETLLRNALTKAKSRYSAPSYLLLFNLNRYMVEFNRGKAFAADLQRSVIAAFAEVLAGAASVEAERPRRCGLAYYAPSFLPRVDEYLPAQSQIFRDNLRICIAHSSSVTREMTQAAAESNKPVGVDETVRAAREAKDPELKGRYYRTALYSLKNDKKFEQMVSLLEGIDGDDLKKVSPIGWDNWRIDAGVNGSLAGLEAKDLGAAYRFVDRTPKNLRPLVRGELVLEPEVVKNKEFYADNLDLMQKEMKALEFPSTDAARLYLELAHHYIKIRPTDSEEIFREAVKYINKADSDNPDFLVEKDWAPMDDYVEVSSELLEIDELSIISSLRSLSSRRSRVRLKLGLLESSLKKYVETKKLVEELRKAKKAVTKPGSNPSRAIPMDTRPA